MILLDRNQKTKGIIVPAVYDVEFVRCTVQEQEECMAKKLHLKNRFLFGHSLHTEALLTDDPVIFSFNLRNDLHLFLGELDFASSDTIS